MRSVACSVVVCAGLAAAGARPAHAFLVHGLLGAREACTRSRNVAQGVIQARRSCMNDSPALRANGFGAMQTIVADFAPDTAVFTTHGEHFTDFDAAAAGFYQWTIAVDVAGLSGGGSAEAGVDATLPFDAGEALVMRFTASGGAPGAPDAALTLTDNAGAVVGATTIGFGPGAPQATLTLGAPGVYTVGISWTWASGALPDGASAYASGAMRIDWAFEAPPCAGDFNGDGQVGAADLAILLGAWGTAAASIDLNSDGVVNAADLAQLLGSWGACP